MDNIDEMGNAASSALGRVLGALHLPSPFPSPLQPKDLLWVHDNTAFPRDGKFYAEFVASFFVNNSSDKVSAAAAKIISQIGLAEDDSRSRAIVAERVEAFLNHIIVGRLVDIQIENGGIVSMPAAGKSGISATTCNVPFQREVKNGDVVKTSAMLPDGWVKEGWGAELVESNCFVAEDEGWGVISDIDDTIKISQVLSIPDLLRNTFAETPKPTPNFPTFYKHLLSTLNPCFFYLSASPYNLYPFLRPFIKENYPLGEIILRDSSWMDAMAVIQSVTVGTEDYKTNEGTKVIGSWLTKRKWMCIGDSTQRDPEAYSNLYRKYPERIKAIWIRKVTGVDLEKEKEKNSDERFETAFKGIPIGIWKTFADPSELYDIVQELQM